MAEATASLAPVSSAPHSLAAILRVSKKIAKTAAERSVRHDRLLPGNALENRRLLSQISLNNSKDTSALCVRQLPHQSCIQVVVRDEPRVIFIHKLLDFCAFSQCTLAPRCLPEVKVRGSPREPDNEMCGIQSMRRRERVSVSQQQLFSCAYPSRCDCFKPRGVTRRILVILSNTSVTKLNCNRKRVCCSSSA